jgi:glycosyltransferase involved in cell wall biosynthesis
MTLVSALICTRNRPKLIEKAVRSLLDASADAELEVIVVDQSPNSDTQAALARWHDDPRLIYRRSGSVGKGVGLNEGLKLARGDTLVLTDDDCEVPHAWARDMANVLERRPRVAIAFCNVVPVPHDSNAGYVPAYERAHSRLLSSLSELRHGLGLGAGMAIRREVAVSLGGFDELFGPGARFPSGDEWDISIRVLASGWQIYETHELAVVHDGFRSFAESRAHVRRDWIALGAVCAKAVRVGQVSALMIPFQFYLANAVWPPLLDLLQLRRPRGLVRMVAFVSGFWDGMRSRMDPHTFRFLPSP